MTRRRHPAPPPGPAPRGHAPHHTVSRRPAESAGPCEPCGGLGPPTHRDLFRVARPGSQAARLGRRYERLCATCASKPETRQQWDAGAFLQPTAHETLSPEERQGFWIHLGDPR